MKRIPCASVLKAALVVSLSSTVYAQSISLELLGRYTTGLADPAAEVASAETVALRGDKMYVTNAIDVSLDIVNVANPGAPRLHRRVDLKPYGSSANSVDVSSKDLIAVGVAASPKTDPGTVVFLTPGGQVVRTATVGSNPDMVTFTADGRRLLVANEGEPDCYGADCTDPEGSISVIEVIPMKATPVVHTITFDNVFIPAGVRIFGPGASPVQDLEPEYITVSEDGTTAWVTLQENNAIARLDLDTLSVTDIFPLGYKDHSVVGQGLDPSDRDSDTPNIQTWSNVLGMYMPDGVAQFQSDGETYLITANEGDARDWPGFAEEIRARALAGLQPGIALIPGATDNAQLGRLTVTSTPPNGDFNNLYVFGSRSFSIWDAANGAQLWDSGDQLEQRTGAEYPDFFNSNSTENDFDSRSDNKGPEPEAVAVGKIGDQTFAFVALERIGGVMVYDISVPNLPIFEQYFVTRDFSADSVGPDSAPEIIRFLGAESSPTGTPMLAIGNEVSGTVILVALTPHN